MNPIHSTPRGPGATHLPSRSHRRQPQATPPRQASHGAGHHEPLRPARLIRRAAAVLVGLTAALLAISAAAPAAFAYVLPPHPAGGTAGLPPVHTIVTGGMPGWQITLIAAAAAILAATASVLLDRARAARRHQTAPSA